MQYLNDAKVLTCLVLLIFIVTAIPIISIVKLLTTSYLAAVIAYLGFLFWILRYAGRFALFPGSTQYIQSDNEDKMSLEIMKRTYRLLADLEGVIQKIIQKQPFLTDIKIGLIFQKNVQGMMDMFGMFQDTLTQRKGKLLHLFKKLHQQLSFSMAPGLQENNEIGLMNFIAIADQPQSIGNLSESQFSFIYGRCESIRRVIQQLLENLKFFEGREKSLLSCQGIKHYCNQESIYEIRFGFYNWRKAYDYEIHLIKTSDKQTIETVIIHNEKGYEQSSQSAQISRNRREQQQQKPAVLFCNPNGVFIQFFGLDNSYVRNYLRMGFKVILWNYRGYGQSTSTPTLSQSQKDAIEVYSFYSAKYTIPVVHGYSIGGHCAVAVARRFTDQVRVLIADRTFASMESMSRAYGCIVSILTKIVFFTDNYCLAQQFLECRNQSKILICDERDEVISEASSLKRAIIENVTRNGGRSQLKYFRSNSSSKTRQNRNGQGNIYDKSQDQENELQSFEVRQYKKWQENTHSTSSNKESSIRMNPCHVEKLVMSLERIFRQNFSQTNPNVHHVTGQREVSDHEVGSMEQQIGKQENLANNVGKLNQRRLREKFVGKLLEILGEIDGGGVVLFDKQQLEHTFQNCKRTELKDTCRGYLLGLSYYGSCRPVKQHRKAYNSQSIKKATIQKLERVFKDVEKLIDPWVESNIKTDRETSEDDIISRAYSDPESQEVQATKCLLYVLKEAQKILILNCQNQAFNKSIGVLIPTSNGHNSDLNYIEFNIISELLEKVRWKSETKEQLRESTFD